MINFPNCKINLGLSIVEKRPDGYHNIETVFYPLPLYDVLEIIPSDDPKTKFSSSGINIPGESSQNLCLKAYELLKNEFNLPSVKMHLHKVIPIGAGLGGGSSDAAQSLIMLNQIFNLQLSEEDLMDYASKLGADCAFFIKNKAAFAFEKGDRFKEIDISLKGYYILIVKPEIHIGTAEAYSGIDPMIHLFSVDQLIEKPLSEWRYVLKNDFEKSIFSNHPEIENIKNELYSQGASYASMSGSGSSVFGIFEKTVDLSKKFKNYFYWSTEL